MTSRSSFGSRGRSWTRSCCLEARPRRPPARRRPREPARAAPGRSRSRVSRRAAASCVAHGSQPPVVVHDGRELGLLATERLAALRVGGDLRPGPLRLDLGEAAFDLVEALLQAHAPPVASAAAARRRPSSLHRPGQLAGVGDGLALGSQLPSGASSPLAASASCIEQMATSIIESSGCLVVMDCSQMPGRKSQRQTECSRRLAPQSQDLVGDRRDDRDEQDPAHDGHPELDCPARRLKSRMLTRMKTTRNSVPQRGWAVGIAADVLHRQRVVVLEGVDGHVLGAVVLEDASDLRRAADHAAGSPRRWRPG